MLGDPIPFDQAFRALVAGCTPFRWQRRLFDEFAEGRIPPTCALPTGLGKTSVIPIWLIALAHSTGEHAILPRRLVYVVDRRTVVDQATAEAERLRDALVRDSDDPVLRAINHALRRSCTVQDRVPLAVSTLRGELADNGDWRTDPARPAIIIGTIDMIGSKLLFSGYGDGRYPESESHASCCDCLGGAASQPSRSLPAHCSRSRRLPDRPAHLHHTAQHVGVPALRPEHL